MEEMFFHCSKKYRVLKPVEYFYDEVAKRMLKTNNLFILDGVSCTGKKRLYFESCDLNCYFFWHKDLLVLQ